MDPATWLLISIAILTTQYALAKVLERKPQPKPYAAAPEEIQPEQPHPAEELEPIPLEVPKQEEEREAEAGQEEPKPAREKPGEAEKPEPEEPESLAPENLEKLSEEISRLKDLLELSQELRKEVEKLAKTLTTPKNPERVN